LTRERIRRIEAKALRKLKHPSRSRKLRSLLDNQRFQLVCSQVSGSANRGTPHELPAPAPRKP
jgi:hypothetical protein